MVYELKEYSEVREYINKNRLAVLAIVNKDRENLWSYVGELLRRLEKSTKSPMGFAITHYQTVAVMLKPFEVEVAKKSVIIKLFLNGECVFEQEGVLGLRTNDETTLRRGIKESLKLYSIDVKFVST